MNRFGLTDSEQELIRDVLRRHIEVTEVKFFGSRAKGNFQPASDIDLALWGNVSASIVAAIAGELDELPLPIRDVGTVESFFLIGPHGRG
jgi:predicted nucleotidyltransferase